MGAGEGGPCDNAAGGLSQEEQEGRITLLDIPAAAMATVLQQLSCRDVCSVSMTSRHFRALVRDAYLWRELLWRDMAGLPGQCTRGLGLGGVGSEAAGTCAVRDEYRRRDEEGEQWRRLTEHGAWRQVECQGPCTAQILRVVCSPTGGLVVGTVFNGEIICFDGKDGAQWAKLSKQTASTAVVACLGERDAPCVVVGGSWDGRVSVWMPNALRQRPVFDQQMTECVQSVAVWEFHDALFVGAGDAAGNVRVWMMRHWRQRHKASSPREDMSTAFSSTPPEQSSCGRGPGTAQWQCVLCERGQSVAWCMASSPEGRFVGCTMGSDVHVWDCLPALEQGDQSATSDVDAPWGQLTLLHVVPAGREGKDQPASLALSRDGIRLAVGLYTGVVKVWERPVWHPGDFEAPSASVAGAVRWAEAPWAGFDTSPGACSKSWVRNEHGERTYRDSVDGPAVGGIPISERGSSARRSATASVGSVGAWGGGGSSAASSVEGSLRSRLGEPESDASGSRPRGKAAPSPSCCPMGYQQGCTLDMGLCLGKVSGLQFVGRYLLLSSPSLGGKVTAYSLSRGPGRQLLATVSWSVPGPSVGCVSVSTAEFPTVARSMDHARPLLWLPGER